MHNQIPTPAEQSRRDNSWRESCQSNIPVTVLSDLVSNQEATPYYSKHEVLIVGNSFNVYYLDLHTVNTCMYSFYLFWLKKITKGSSSLIIIPFCIYSSNHITGNFCIPWKRPFHCLVIMALNLVNDFTASYTICSFKIVVVVECTSSKSQATSFTVFLN